ncbi:MAG: hypothetical protein JWO64_1983 [Hyphomicrobiales bacterium]|nr:hypothetical protein [Hyphomicrobiales bacterium]
MTPIRHTFILLGTTYPSHDAGRHILEVRTHLEEMRHRASDEEAVAVSDFEKVVLADLRGLGAETPEVGKRQSVDQRSHELPGLVQRRRGEIKRASWRHP